MGLLLSILVACVGVVELLAFYSNVRRSFVSVSTQTNLTDIGERYREELRRRRYLEVEDIEVEISNALPKSRSPSPMRLLLTETRPRSRSPTPRRFVVTEDSQDDNREPRFPLPKQFIVTEPEEARRSPSPRRLGEQESVFRRSPSPYPSLVLAAPRNSICGDNSNSRLPEVDEESVSRSPTPEKVEEVRYDRQFLDSLDGVRNKKPCKRPRKKKDDSLSSNNDAQTAKTLTEAANALKNVNVEANGESAAGSSSKTAEPFWVN